MEETKSIALRGGKYVGWWDGYAFECVLKPSLSTSGSHHTPLHLRRDREKALRSVCHSQ